MKPTETQFEMIAEDLECGINSFYNIKTGELKNSFINDDWGMPDDEAKHVEKKSIENSADYFKFEVMNSTISYETMSDFIYEIDDQNLKQIIFDAINKPKPFQHFKRVIDNLHDVRKQWFNFKKKRYIKFAKNQFENNSQDNDE